ncbi:hypothetical protein DdX_18430 [Ditylenchus destructor]|uniref:Uncharacterized protein n=1 Tax=Ditylenchus destructor TaxID=166010 RepID=A0AAD4MMC3_9BILA|nr:hypothetical protein DdX_18430 [Ditylenchus destructor]
MKKALQIFRTSVQNMMSEGSNKLCILSVICTILTICRQAHAPEMDYLSSPEGDEKVKSMKNDIVTKLDHVEGLEKLDLSKVPAENREKVTKLIGILKELKTIKLSRKDETKVQLEKVKRAQLKWQEAKAIFPQVTRKGRHAKPNGEVVRELKSLLNEMDSNKPESEIMAEQHRIRASLSAFKKKLGLSGKALSGPGAPNVTTHEVTQVTKTENTKTEINETEIKDNSASAVAAFSEYFDSYFAKTIKRLEKEIGYPRRRRKRGIVTDILMKLWSIVSFIVMILLWLCVCIFSGVGPVLWFAFAANGYDAICSDIYNFSLKYIFSG